MKTSDAAEPAHCAHCGAILKHLVIAIGDETLCSQCGPRAWGIPAYPNPVTVVIDGTPTITTDPWVLLRYAKQCDICGAWYADVCEHLPGFVRKYPPAPGKPKGLLARLLEYFK